MSFLPARLMVAQVLLHGMAQHAGHFVHQEPSGAFIASYHLHQNGDLSLNFEVPQGARFFGVRPLRLSGGPHTYTIEFTPESRGVDAMYDGIRELYQDADIQPGDLTTLTYDSARPDILYATFEGRKLHFERWILPRPGEFEGSQTGELSWRYRIYPEHLVDITLSCPKFGLQMLHNGSFEDSTADLIEVVDLPPSERHGRLDFEGLRQAYDETCEHSSRYDVDFKALMPLSPYVIHLAGSDGSSFPLTRTSGTLGTVVCDMVPLMPPVREGTHRLRAQERSDGDTND
ncbi:hypothetical protein FOZ63_014571 [Perkinsus olseni]|uniref:Uncharacterized protein n=1 Tax=Perkinsus olseni TaxID=32597 RepID=A0A7J6RZZ2_PEROL|nr:hypothetical protein FOZ63_014571 [Perkinsus olseni]